MFIKTEHLYLTYDIHPRYITSFSYLFFTDIFVLKKKKKNSTFKKHFPNFVKHFNFLSLSCIF